MIQSNMFCQKFISPSLELQISISQSPLSNFNFFSFRFSIRSIKYDGVQSYSLHRPKKIVWRRYWGYQRSTSSNSRNERSSSSSFPVFSFTLISYSTHGKLMNIPTVSIPQTCSTIPPRRTFTQTFTIFCDAWTEDISWLSTNIG